MTGFEIVIIVLVAVILMGYIEILALLDNKRRYKK
jgi:hypothetical protein